MDKRVLITSIVLTLAVIFSGKTFGQASGTATATVNVVLSDARSISIETNAINLNFNNPTDYVNGVSSTVSNHLHITSSAGFQIKVGSGVNLTGGSSNTIPANTITVTPAFATGTNPGGITPTPQKLGTVGGLPIVTCTNGTMPITFDVTYKTDGGAYIGKKADTYTTTVTYDISAN